MYIHTYRHMYMARFCTYIHTYIHTGICVVLFELAENTHARQGTNQ